MGFLSWLLLHIIYDKTFPPDGLKQNLLIYLISSILLFPSGKLMASRAKRVFDHSVGETDLGLGGEPGPRLSPLQTTLQIVKDAGPVILAILALLFKKN